MINGNVVSVVGRIVEASDVKDAVDVSVDVMSTVDEMIPLSVVESNVEDSVTTKVAGEIVEVISDMVLTEGKSVVLDISVTDIVRDSVDKNVMVCDVGKSVVEKSVEIGVVKSVLDITDVGKVAVDEVGKSVVAVPTTVESWVDIRCMSGVVEPSVGSDVGIVPVIDPVILSGDIGGLGEGGGGG